MAPPSAKPRPGDLVEVKSPDEILQTLDAEGTLDHLPFMPEMVELCGRRFRVARRVVKTCFSGPNSYGAMREFRGDDVVTLEGLRCSGVAHDGCQKACMIFWRDAWLRTVDDAGVRSDVSAKVDSAARERLRVSLKTKTDPTTYFCQASELLSATEHLSRRQQFGKCLSEVRDGNCSAWHMARRLVIWLFWKIRRKLLGDFARGRNRSTPTESLNLQPGEWVEVKGIEEIRATLNETGHNRGMYFSPDLRLACGRRYRVKGRLDKLVVDGTGTMRRLHNTVYLDGSLCGCANIAVGGCSRDEVVYWREIWLRRPPAT